MWFSLKIVVSAALAFALTVPQASAAPTISIPTGGMKVKAEAKGDCAQNPTTILITDSTTTCSIEISITPPKRYADVSFAIFLDENSYSSPTYLTVSREKAIGGRGFMYFSNVKTSAKGKATVGVLKTGLFGGITPVITSATETVHVQVTNAKAPNKGFTARAKSNPIVITFQQSIPASGCGHVYQEESGAWVSPNCS